MPSRIGLIVPSSNTTMEIEIPAMLARRAAANPSETLTTHSSRMRMRRVSAEELKSMDADSDRCAAELADASCDIYVYACLVAIMARGGSYHEESEARLAGVVADNGAPGPVVSSAGALVTALRALEARRIAVVTPYVDTLTAMVGSYLENQGFEVRDTLSLNVADNLAVGRLNTDDLLGHYKKLDLSGCDALVLSACVQMPSLAVVQQVEDECGLPVVTAATATVYSLLSNLGVAPAVPDAGVLLAP